MNNFPQKKDTLGFPIRSVFAILGFPRSHSYFVFYTSQKSLFFFCFQDTFLEKLWSSSNNKPETSSK